ncbi:MAG: TraK family protein [Desulfobulbus sp.]|nr:TraK family protein [Desulfobulbus sp.]
MAAKKGEMNPVRLPRGAARVQFVAHLDEIKRLLGKGYSLQRIYNTLLEAGKITMAPRTFTKIARPAPPKPKANK